jgi:tetratricopeptide (TPR) repeat protein
VRAGMPRNEAIQHGEAGLTSVTPADAEALLDRLAVLAAKPYEVVDLYERQVSRSKAPADRTRALARAAQVASHKGAIDRARGFFELALTGSPSDETLAHLETTAREGDRVSGGEKLRRALCMAMASGGQGARDGGRTRGALLRRAASMANRDLNDVEQAFAWLGDALIAHVDSLTLDSLDGLGMEVGDPRRSEAALTHALTEVFDGPLVRQLLARRAKIRREQMDDKSGAATDLKKLHDLSPNDQAVMDDLSGLLTELGDYRGMVQLYEDQILRGKDMGARAELARKVARMWEEQLTDPREAADAWRRVLRMKQGDAEATAGLERARSNMLKKPAPGASGAYAPPKLQPSPEPPPVAAVSPSGRGPISEGPTSRVGQTIETRPLTDDEDLSALAEMDEPPTQNQAVLPSFESRDRGDTASTVGGDVDDDASDATAPHAAEDDIVDTLATSPNAVAGLGKPIAPAMPPAPPTKPQRPRDMWFRSSQDEITMSAPDAVAAKAAAVDDDDDQLYTSPGVSGYDDMVAEASRGADEADDFGKTGELGSMEFLDATLARPQRGEPAVVRDTHDGDDVLIADDLADIVEVEEDEIDVHEDSVASQAPASDASGEHKGDKSSSAPPRSVPPPLPRS